MTVYNPRGVKARGATSVVLVKTLADPTAPKLTEVNAATSLDVSCFLKGLEVTVDQNKGDSPRLCTDAPQQRFGDKTTTVTDLEYVFDPTAADTADDNKAWSLCKEGTAWFAVFRLGYSAQKTAFAAAQKVWVLPITLGQPVPVLGGSDEFSETTFRQAVQVDGPLGDAVALG